MPCGHPARPVTHVTVACAICVTPDGRVLQVNPALVRMLGYQSAEELTAAISDVTRQVIVLPKDRKRMRRLEHKIWKAKDRRRLV